MAHSVTAIMLDVTKDESVAAMAEQVRSIVGEKGLVSGYEQYECEA